MPSYVTVREVLWDKSRARSGSRVGVRSRARDSSRWSSSRALRTGFAPRLTRRLGRASVDAALIVAIVFLGQQVVDTAIARADKQASIDSLTREARSLYAALDRYFEDNRAYPSEHAEPRFDLATLEPLRQRGYYRGAINHHLLRKRIDAYESPDDRGTNREYWLEMTLAADPSVRLLVCRSDDAPLGGGDWLDGVFILRDGALEAL